MSNITAIDPASPAARIAERSVFSAGVRSDALGHALYALGDAALSHDGWLRPRVWELADQIAAYINDGSRP